MILVDAMFINKGGGAVLLQYLIEKIMSHPARDSFFFLLDPRFKKPEILTANYLVVENKLQARISFFKQHKGDCEMVFCFANTPPPIKLKVPVYTYSHNQKLFEAPYHKFSRKHFSTYLKYLFVKLYNRNTDYYVVQTPHMVEEIIKLRLKDRAHCLTLPFYDDDKYSGPHPSFEERPAEFVFVSNPSPQKNHVTLLDAWELLLEKGHQSKLHLTIDDTGPHILARISELNGRGAQIINHGVLDPRPLYTGCRYLIYPSVMESFGLPLIEAVDCGMKVLSSDLEYVYDVIEPSLTFKPMDKSSIAEAVIAALTTTLPTSRVVTQNKINELINLLCTP